MLAAPALRLAAAVDMLFADTGSDVGFSLRHRVENHEGGPTMVWSRQFRFPNATRRFDAVMQYNAARGCIVDWLGGNGGLETGAQLWQCDGRAASTHALSLEPQTRIKDRKETLMLQSTLHEFAGHFQTTLSDV